VSHALLSGNIGYSRNLRHFYEGHRVKKCQGAHGDHNEENVSLKENIMCCGKKP